MSEALSVIDIFDRFSQLIGESEFSYSKKDAAKDQAQIIFFCNKTGSLLEERSSFFNRFDYTWAREEGSYRSSIEAQLQYFLLRVISEISETHPDYLRLNNICVRIVSSQYINTEAVNYQEGKFILLSTSFIKIMQAWIVLFVRLAGLGVQFSDTGELICESEYLFGRTIEKAVRYNWSECGKHLDKFISRIISYYSGSVPYDDMSISGLIEEALSLDRTEKFKEADDLVEFVIKAQDTILLAEMFFVCHEIVHLLKHDEQVLNRSDREELEADHGAASLMMIFNSTLFSFLLDCNKDSSDEVEAGYAKKWTTMVFKDAIFIGPALFYSTIQTTLVIQMTYRFIETLNKTAADSNNSKSATSNADIEEDGEFTRIRRELTLNSRGWLHMRIVWRRMDLT